MCYGVEAMGNLMDRVWASWRRGSMDWVAGGMNRAVADLEWQRRVMVLWVQIWVDGESEHDGVGDGFMDAQP
ncbi:hypothetical protein M0R45_025942 [Rubus argutus]|uniref:Uncharacterized protein n=1 Tax=Rubus argutus TaxID=59490 RepID=A0AAW1WW48_RUBAR